MRDPTPIERMCRYVTDDGTIAAYFQVSREIVAKARREMHIPQQRRFSETRVEGTNKSNGTGTDARPACGDKDGCEALAKRMNALAWRESRLMRITEAQALWMLQDRPTIEQIKARATV